MEHKINTKWLVSAAAVLVIGILLMLNFYGYRSMNFELKKAGAASDSEQVSYEPHLTYPKGEYELEVKGSGEVTVKSAEGNTLGSGKAGASFNIELDKDESDIIIYSSQSGNLSGVTVSKNGMLYNDLGFLTLLLILAMLYILYVRFLKKGSRDDNAVIMLVLLGAVFASYPLFSGTIGFGHDLNFHLYRIEGIKDGILSGQFPVRIHPTHNNGYGYITASVYPELFLYFPAVLRIFGLSPVMAYNTFLFGVNVATALIMYYSAKGMSKSKYVGLIASIIYTLSTWRVMNLYYRAAIGEALDMVFFPLVIYGLYCLLKGDKKKWWVLALGCTGVYQSHVISTVFVVITIIAAVLMFIKNFISDRRWLGFFKAGVLTVLLNLWYLVSFITYYFGLDMAIRHTKENTEFFSNAIFPTQLFNIFNTNFGYSQLLDKGMRSDMSLSLGVGVTICLVIGIAYFIFRKKKEIKNESFVFGILAFGVLLLFMATTLFPWELLQQNKLINMFAGTVRMPWRFLSLASPIFCIAAAIIIGAVSKSDMSKRIVIMVTCFVCAITFVSWGTAYTTQLDPALKKGYAVSTSGAVGLDNEYYVVGTNADRLTAEKYETSDGVKVDSYYKSGTNIEAEISGAKNGSYIEVPLLYYPGYSAKDNNGNKLETEDGTNHVLRINLQNGTDTVKIKYSGLWSFKLADAVTILTLLGMSALWFYHKRRNLI